MVTTQTWSRDNADMVTRAVRQHNGQPKNGWECELGRLGWRKSGPAAPSLLLDTNLAMQSAGLSWNRGSVHHFRESNTSGLTSNCIRTGRGALSQECAEHSGSERTEKKHWKSSQQRERVKGLGGRNQVNGADLPGEMTAWSASMPGVSTAEDTKSLGGTGHGVGGVRRRYQRLLRPSSRATPRPQRGQRRGGR